MEARSQTAPQAHVWRDATFLLSPLGADSSIPAGVGLKSSRRLAAEAGKLPGTAWGKKNFGDREHLRGYPVSKRIEGVGHRVWKRCPSPALEGSCGNVGGL